jgi:cyclophilin family peptidyl-prolyl cis-trans isomerase
MPSADKRARKKENARAAREQREAALKRSKRRRSTITFAVFGALFIGVILVISLVGGGKKKADSTTTTTTTPAFPAGCVKTVPPKTTKPTYKSAPAMTIDPTKTYVAHFTTTCGDFDVTLDAKDAPKTVNSFVFLAGKHFYDGLTFQRVAKDFVVQGGDPKGNGSGGPGYNLPTEPPKDGYAEGSVAMANAGPNTTGSQFFVVLSATGAKGLGGPPYLYSSLGKVTKGMDAVQKLGSLYNKDQDPNDPSTQKTSVPLYMFKVTTTESAAGGTSAAVTTSTTSAK